MEMEFTTENADGDEITLDVEYSYYAGCRGAREAGTGLALEPDDAPEIEILSVTDDQGEDYELSDDDVDAVQEKAFEDAISSAEDAKGEALIAAYEARMEY